jgi:hypothetical protein
MIEVSGGDRIPRLNRVVQGFETRSARGVKQAGPADLEAVPGFNRNGTRGLRAFS